jgi:hypothetical protein
MTEKLKWAIIIFIAIFAVYVPVYIIQISDVNRERSGCERLNSVRSTQYQFYQRDIENRQQIVGEEQANLDLLTGPNAEQEIKDRYGITLSEEEIVRSIAEAENRIELNKEIIQNDIVSSNELVRSAEEYATEPGAVVVDCERAYERPWPID